MFAVQTLLRINMNWILSHKRFTKQCSGSLLLFHLKIDTTVKYIILNYFKLPYICFDIPLLYGNASTNKNST